MTNYFIIPGLGNSGPEHWQSYFENSSDGFVRINQKHWDAPVAQDWVATIDNALEGYDLSNVVLIGHSLGCTAIAMWANQFGKRIKGALLVAPSDLEAPRYTFPTQGFDHVPLTPIKFKTLVVASTNDEWVSLERARFFANCWGSEFITIRDAGHINADSGYGHWPEGLELLKKL